MKFFFFLDTKSSANSLFLKITDPINQIDLTCRLAICIEKTDWDVKKQRPKNIYLKKSKKINNQIDELKIVVRQWIKEKNRTNCKVSPDGLSAKIRKIISAEERIYEESSLLYFVQNYIKSRTHLICKTTYKRYKVFHQLIQRFEGYLSERILIKNVDIELINHFCAFCKFEEYSDSTVHRTINFIKTILNFAEHKNIKTHIRQLNNIRREKYKKEFAILTEQEILTIKNTEIPESLQVAKDWLLVSCYTGQRISDFMNFCVDKIIKIKGRYCLNFVQQKTKKEITIPLHPAVINVVKANQNTFPTKIDIQKYNTDIKEIAKISGLKQKIVAKKRIGYRSRLMEVEKWEVITSHIGRRSFATNFYGKIPTALLMEATGHSTEEMFLKYISSINKERIISLSDHFNKVYKEKNIQLDLHN